MPLTLTSPAFADGDRLPDKYARAGRNLSPPLRWAGVPEGTRSLVLVLDDPDAPNGTFHHWCVYNLPPDRAQLAESAETAPDRQHLRIARNDFGNAHYDGPEPPPGDPPHRYRFRLAALAVPSLALPARAGIAEIWAEARKRAIEEAELAATWSR